MLGNATAKRFVLAGVAPAEIPAEETAITSVEVSNAGLAVGDIVAVTPRGNIGNGISVYGTVIDATHIGLAFVNGRGTPSTPNVLTYDVAVITATGQTYQSV